MGGLIIIIMVGISFIYGFEGNLIYVQSGNSDTLATPESQFYYSVFFMMTCLFVVVGFGLIFAFLKKGTALGLLISLFTVSFALVIAPPLQKWWFNVFVGGFEGW